MVSYSEFEDEARRDRLLTHDMLRENFNYSIPPHPATLPGGQARGLTAAVLCRALRATPAASPDPAPVLHGAILNIPIFIPF